MISLEPVKNIAIFACAPAVNFINVLRAHFLYKSAFEHSSNPKRN